MADNISEEIFSSPITEKITSSDLVFPTISAPSILLEDGGHILLENGLRLFLE